MSTHIYFIHTMPSHCDAVHCIELHCITLHHLTLQAYTHIVQIPVHTYLHIYIYIFTYIYIYIHIYKYVYTHIYMSMHMLNTNFSYPIAVPTLRCWDVGFASQDTNSCWVASHLVNASAWRCRWRALEGDGWRNSPKTKRCDTQTNIATSCSTCRKNLIYIKQKLPIGIMS